MTRLRREPADDLFDRQRDWSNRTASIDAMIRHQRAKTGETPTVEFVASMFAMPVERVAEHFVILGLPT